MKLSNYNPQYLEYTINSSVALGQYEELEKRLRFCPFDGNDFMWQLVYADGPLFFVVRHMLRRLGIHFEVLRAPVAHEDALAITAWTSYDGKDVKIRGQVFPAVQMPLYVESGEWDMPQCNPVFDWSRAQAWGYLIHHGLVDDYERECVEVQ